MTLARRLTGLAREAGGAFVPTDLSGLILYYEADTITGKSDGDSLSVAWADGSGNANDATLVGTHEPIYKTAGGPNSNPYVQFPAAVTALVTPPNVLSGLTAATLFVVAKCANTTSTGTYGEFGSPLSTVYTFSNGLIYDDFGTSVRKDAITPGTTLTNWHIYMVKSASGAWSNRHDGGAAVFSTGTNTVAFTTTPSIGAHPSYSPNANDIGIAALLVYDTALNNSNADLVGNYLATKYGTTWTAVS